MADVTQTNPPTMAPPGGHYSHAVTANGFVFVSGELPIAPDGTKLNDKPFEQQAQQVLDNVALALKGAGSGDRQAHPGARLCHRHRQLAGVQHALCQMGRQRAPGALRRAGAATALRVSDRDRGGGGEVTAATSSSVCAL